MAVEACVRMKKALVYDPALSDQAISQGDPSYYFTKLRGVLEKLLSEIKVPSPYGAEWRCSYAKGGQQRVEIDSVSCGLYSVEWIKHRLRTAIERRMSKEAGYNWNYYVVERLREGKEMKRLETWEADARRLWLAHDALSAIKLLKAGR